LPGIVIHGPIPWTQGFAVNQTKGAIRKLHEQSNKMGDRFADWEAELVANSTPEQLTFAQFVQDRQADIQEAYQGNRIMPIRDSVRTQIFGNNHLVNNSLIGQVRSFINPSDVALFNLKIGAFRDAITLEQREHFPASGALIGGLITACQEIEKQLGLNQPIFNGSYSDAIQTLKGLLEAAIPEELGPYRNDILQQIECFMQFEGWTSDMRQLLLLSTTSDLTPDDPLAMTPAKKRNFTITMPEQETAVAKTYAETRAERGYHV
jgi:hypothetical protein